MQSNVALSKNLSFMAAIPLNKEQFEKRVARIVPHSREFVFLGHRPAVIDFYAEWCGPCQMVAPMLDDLSKTYDGKVDFYKINVDEENELSGHFDIRSIPTLFLVTAKGEVRRFTGALSRDRLKQLVDEVL